MSSIPRGRHLLATGAAVAAGLTSALLFAAPAHAAAPATDAVPSGDSCPPATAPGSVCIPGLTFTTAYEAGEPISPSVTIFRKEQTRTVSTSGMSVPLAWGCSSSGEPQSSTTVAFPDLVSTSGEHHTISGSTTVPDVCDGQSVFLRSAGPVTGTVLSDVTTTMDAVWHLGDRSSFGGGCAAPGPLNGVSQMAALGGLAPIGGAGVFLATVGVIAWTRKSRNNPPSPTR